ncbi:GreA/GreB family elongation factor, partial [Azospirillum sp.]|uniref:GreA/GreB family elongation factor n=1 Tax=Azospirillum sp. TaxID=34012 RepID=UPI002D38AC0F
AIADDVVTMNSRLVLHLDDEKMDVSLVYPQDADEHSGKLSVLSDIGTAILGYRTGDTIDWVVGGRTRRIAVDKLTYQPESAGDFHL